MTIAFGGCNGERPDTPTVVHKSHISEREAEALYNKESGVRGMSK
jgi:hypothetical protein